MGEYLKQSQPFAYTGLDLSSPIDRIREGALGVADNIRSYTKQQVEGRPGLLQINATPLDQTSIHTIGRLNDPLASASQSYARVLGAGTKVYSDNSAHTVFTSRATGFDGKPLQLVPHRPNQSVEAWMYIANASKMGKLNVSGTFYNMGIAPPNQPLTAQIAPLQYKTLSDFEATTGWTNTGTAGAITTPDRVNTTITYILFDTGTTGWALVQPAAFTTDLQPGILLTVNTGGGTAETVLVDSTYQPIADTTIGSISFDTGSSGACSIQPATPTDGLVLNSLIRINDGGGTAENVRVTAVIQGPNGISSFRCTTVNTHATAETLKGSRAFRANFASTHVATETLITKAFLSAVATGVGNLDFSGAIDLSQIPLTGGGFRPAQTNDQFHLSVRIDNPSNLVEFKAYLDYDGTTNDFAHNYFLFTASPNDFQPVASGQLTTTTTRQKAIQTTFINTSTLDDNTIDNSDVNLGRGRFLPLDGGDPGTGRPIGGQGFVPTPTTPVLIPVQTVTGTNQWSELVWTIGDMGVFGSDSTRGLKDIKALRLSFNCTAGISINVDAWWLGGTFGPDASTSAEGNGIHYTYVARSDAGAQSNPAPPIRVGVQPVRQAVGLTLTQHPDPQVTKLDIYRDGGTLLNFFYYVGTTPNSATPTFTDILPDSTVIAQDRPLRYTRFQPFPSVDTYKSGTCNVVGTSVIWVSGDTFSTGWARNTTITINGTLYTFYNSPADTTHLFLNENAGTLSAVPFEIREPVILQYSVPALWGPWGGGASSIYFFACGDNNRPGTLLWTNPNDPDSASDRNFLEITAPSEPLLNGVIWNQRIYAFSSEGMWEIVPNFATIQQQIAQQILPGQSLFLANEIPVGRGLFSRYALCAGDFIYYLSRDGIYRTTGQGIAECITTDLAPLFPHDGQPGRTVNNISPPDLTQTDSLRLEWGDSMLRFWYRDTGGTLRCLVRDCTQNLWLSRDYFTPPCQIAYTEPASGVNSTLYGATDGHLYQLTGTSDSGSPILGTLITKAVNGGDDRLQKLFGDGFIDLNTNNQVVTYALSLDNFSQTISTGTLTTSSRELQVLDISNGAGVQGINLSLFLTWSITNSLQLIEWGPSVIIRPEITERRFTDYDDCGRIGAKFMQGVWIEADTNGFDKQLRVQYDDSITGAVFTINHNGKELKSYTFPVPFYAKLVRLSPGDGVDWNLYQVRSWIFNDAPDLALQYTTPPTTDGLLGFQHFFDCWIATVGAVEDIIFTVTFDDVDYPLTIPAPGPGAVKSRVIFPAVKHLYHAYDFRSTSGFRLNMQACEVRMKQWGTQSDRIVAMFGEMNYTTGATI